MPAYRVKLRRGTSAEHANFVGAEGEVTVDTDKKRLVVHDGVTPGGFLIAALEDVKTDISEYTDSEGLMGGYTYDVQGTELPLTSTSPIVNYTVTVASGFRYNGRGIPGGPGDVFYLRNDTAGETEFTENPHITLQTGYTYVFDMSDASNIGHPLQFTTDMGQTAFTSGITTLGTAGQAGATVTFTVPSPRPLNLMYYCGVHGAGMGGQITVGSDAYVAPTVGAGDQGSYTLAGDFHYSVINKVAVNTSHPLKPHWVGGISIDPNDNSIIIPGNGTWNGTTSTHNGAYRSGIIKVSNTTGQSPTVQWSHIMADLQGNQPLYDTATDSSGNIYAVMWGRDSSKYGGIFSKFDSNGNLLWERLIADSSQSSSYGRIYPQDITINKESNTAIIGCRDADLSDGFIQSWDISGATPSLNWIKKWSFGADNSYDGYISKSTVDAEGNVYAVMSSNAREERLNISPRRKDVWVVKLSSDGTILWEKQWASDQTDGFQYYYSVYGLAVDSNGNITVAGEVMADPSSLGYRDWAFQISPDGSTINWSKLYGQTIDGSSYNSTRPTIRNLSVDFDDNLYLCGSGAGGIVKLNSDGVIDFGFTIQEALSTSWTQNIGSDYRVLFDNDNNLVIGGSRYYKHIDGNNYESIGVFVLPPIGSLMPYGTHGNQEIVETTSGIVEVDTTWTEVSNIVISRATLSASMSTPITVHSTSSDFTAYNTDITSS